MSILQQLEADIAQLEAKAAELDAQLSDIHGKIERKRIALDEVRGYDSSAPESAIVLGPSAAAEIAPSPTPAEGTEAAAKPHILDPLPGHLLQGKSLPEAAKLVIMFRSRPMTTGEIAQELVVAGVRFAAKDAESSVSFAVNRAKAVGDLIRTEPGKWGLATWSRAAILGRDANEHARNTRDGLALAKERGVRLGRKPSLTTEQKKLCAEEALRRPKGVTIKAHYDAIAEKFGISRASVSAYTNQYLASRPIETEGAEDLVETEQERLRAAE